MQRRSVRVGAVAVLSSLLASFVVLLAPSAAWAAPTVTAYEADAVGGTYSLTLSGSTGPALGSFTGGTTQTTITGTWVWGSAGSSAGQQGIKGSCSDGTLFGPVFTDTLNSGNHGPKSASFTCPGVHYPVTWQAYDWAGAKTYGSVYAWPDDPRWPGQNAWCTGSNFVDASAGWTAASGLTLRFKWTATPVPAAGWQVQNAAQTTTYGTLPATATVDGSPGYFWGKFAAAAAPSGIVITAPANASGQSGCSIALTSIKQADVAPGASTYGATDPDDAGGADCGWNPYCYTKAALRWAFVPDQAHLDGMKTSLASLVNGRLPFALMSQAKQMVDDIVPDIGCIEACWPNWSISGQQILPYDSSASQMLRDWRPWLQAAVWVLMLVPLAVFIFWQMLPIVGGSGSA